MKIFLMIILTIIDRFFKTFAIANNCHILNYGISFGLFSESNIQIKFLLTIASLIILLIFAKYTIEEYKKNVPVMANCVVLLGGASNLFDKIFYGGVVDFISIYVNQLPFFICNIADIYITCGLFFIIIEAYFKEDHCIC